ncbi:MAG: response regulator [Ferruginibacter sp.]|uniref:ATP-binding response regulator n=1 Tax=Ferruginibacter sp. TaxID=1940288 RepID=UPI00265AC092|nr:response regulator [Ferruginibacter sp.]MDB5276999.1 response regulator [Ferruginibacter sp.]
MILIVDDRPENIFALKSILELHSFPVDTALSGEEALRKSLKNHYSLIILDVQMPGMDGFEVADFLAGNKNTMDIPLIFLSAVNTEKKFITKGYSSGAIDYITKPIDQDILLLKVKTFHRLYEQNRELTLAKQQLQSEIEVRKKAQQQAQEKANELNGILASIPQVAFTATADGNIDFVNEHWYNYSSSVDTFPEVHSDDPCIIAEWRKILQSKQPKQLEIRIAKLQSKEYKYHLLSVVPVVENGMIVKWVGTFTDIEEQKQALKTKDDFLSMASHELKTPLTSIKGYVQLLESMQHDESTTIFLKRTITQVHKLEGLINDLLDISKIDNGELKFELAPVDFEKLLFSTLEMLRHIHPEIKIIHKGNAAATIMANDIRLEQVIINFISNAIKYSPQSKYIEVTSELTPANHLYFAVKDWGIGISPENQKNIFSKFYRVSEAATCAQGLGIGLYICAEILKRHGADFGVISEPGDGALFYFNVPAINKV